jgi:hypothetical protein
LGYLGRDIEVVSINPEQYLVVSCDSCGAIGLKSLDKVQIAWSITGRLTARVTLFEIMAVGAVPKVMTVAISNEPQPTGEEIIKGVKGELEYFALSIPLAVSTEKNIPTQQTGLGISVTGIAEKNQLRLGTSLPGDDVFCFGLPKVGPEVADPEDPEIVQLKHLNKLLETPGVHDIIPVGSRGIQTEAQQLVSNSNCSFHVDSSCVLNLTKSAGPSTCLIVSASSQIAQRLVSGYEQLPIHKIGTII